MSEFSRRIRPDVDRELAQARRAEREGRAVDAFGHLERVHVLGQASTLLHVRVHALMLRWAWRQRRPRECAGQLLRIGGAATKTALGLVPAGNTGGADVSPFRRMPIPPDLESKIRSALARVEGR